MVEGEGPVLISQCVKLKVIIIFETLPTTENVWEIVAYALQTRHCSLLIGSRG